MVTSVLVKGSGSDGGRGQHLRLILEKVWEGDFVFTLISINRGEGFFLNRDLWIELMVSRDRNEGK